MRVLVVDKNRKPLMPCHPARAKELMKKGRAKVLRRYPFTIIVDREGGDVQPLRLKIDPGSKVTGVAVVASAKRGEKVVWASEIEHRGWLIKQKLEARASLRRTRRNRKTRYRQCRFSNPGIPKGWLPPSLKSRVFNTLTWVRRISKFAPVSDLSMEAVKFDTQKMQNPEISGVEYQQGKLQGYEVREYLLEKFNRTCVYCQAQNVPLEIEHILPSSRGGSDRVSNLALACRPCNQKKGSQTAEEFGHPKIQAQALKPLKDAAAVNATRNFLRRELDNFGIPVEIGTGGQTKFNRCSQNLLKEHWIDAACVADSGSKVFIPQGMTPLRIKAMGHGNRQMCITDSFGFPKKYRQRIKIRNGFQTGDIVRDTLNNNIGRVMITASPYYKVAGKSPNFKHLVKLHYSDGYSYN